MYTMGPLPMVSIVLLVAGSFIGGVFSGSVCTPGNDAYTTCLSRFTTLLDGATSLDQVYEKICSIDGRLAMACYIDFIKQCPELTEAVDGIDMSTLADDGMDFFCEITTGPCKIVQKCFAKIPDLSTFSYESQLQSLAAISDMDSLYTVLPYYIALLCGPLKDYLLCFVDSIANCPSLAAKLEELTSAYTNVSVNGLIQPTLNQMSTFMRGYCTLDNGLEGSAQCVANALEKTEFTTCYSKTKEEIKGKKSCTSYNKMKQCVVDNVPVTCGKDSARLFASGMPLFYGQYLPYDCDPVSQASFAQMSFLTILGALLANLMRILKY